MKNQTNFLLFILTLVFFETSYSQDTLTWAEVKPIYLKAIETSVRTEVGDWWPYDFMKQVNTFEEKEEVICLWILAHEASYTDLIIPGLGIYMNLYDDAITRFISKGKRQQLFLKELNGLIEILEILDKQIYTFIRARAVADSCYTGFLTKKLDREPTKEERRDRTYLTEFKTQYPNYAQRLPGFFSTSVGCHKGERTYEQYHAKELKQLKEIVANLPGKISKKEYKALLERFEGVLMDAVKRM